MKKGDMIKLKRPNGATQSAMRFIIHHEPDGGRIIAVELNDSIMPQMAMFDPNDVEVVNEPLPDCMSLRIMKG